MCLAWAQASALWRHASTQLVVGWQQQIEPPATMDGECLHGLIAQAGFCTI